MYRVSSEKLILLPSYYTVITADNIDSSGMRFTLTRTPRRYNSSISGVGAEVNTNLFVPPNIDEFDIYGYCNSDCTSQVCKMIYNSVLYVQMHVCTCNQC